MAERTEHRLAHSRTAVAEGRELARDAIRDRLPEDKRDDFLLMVSEVVANAIRHAPPEEDGRIALRFEIEEAVARAIVIDGGAEFEFERATFDPTTPHWGLQFVDRLASRWGLSLDGQKAVWFEVDR